MSQKDFYETQIGEHKYQVYMLPAMKSHQLLLGVFKMLGPSIGPLLDKFTGKNVKQIMNTEIDSDFLSKATSLFFSNLDSDIIDSVIQQFAAKTMFDGKKLKDLFDLHFQGKLDEMYQWFMFAVRVQWGNSLSALWKSIGSQSAVQESK